MIKKIIYLSLAILSISLIVFVIYYGGERSKAVVCDNINVEISVPEGALAFMTAGDVIKELDNNKLKIKGVLLDSIDINHIESVLNSNSLFEASEVSKSYLNNAINIKLLQKYPKYILQCRDTMFYVGENLDLIPINMDYMVDVPMISSDNDSIYKNPSVVKLLDYISANKKWEDFFGQIYVDKKKGFIMIPRIANVSFIYGYPEDWEKALKKTDIFLDNILPRKGWDGFEYVNLGFDGQIIVK